ncbi:MAG: DUF3450 domain-containing protein [Desulfobacterales bacterium]|nr:DUF3450 domain-containing protein [Desulfobacterales bacterium]
MYSRILVAVFMMAWVAGGTLPVLAQSNQVAEEIGKSVQQAVDTRQATQKEEEGWRSEKQALLAAYDRLQEEEKRLRITSEQLQAETVAAEVRIASMEKQLRDTEEISSRILPFLQELVNRLKKQVLSDMPFLVKERTQRIERLTELMTDPGVTVSEKYRKVMEALLVEAEYGNSVEVYQETLSVAGTSRLVNIFRLGRIGLFYQSLDRKECGAYDVAAAEWRPLADAFNRAVGTAIDIGAKRRPIELLTLPLGRMAQR